MKNNFDRFKIDSLFADLFVGRRLRPRILEFISQFFFIIAFEGVPTNLLASDCDIRISNIS